MIVRIIRPTMVSCSFTTTSKRAVNETAVADYDDHAFVSEWHSPGHPDRIVDCSFYLYRHSPSFHFKLYLGEDFVLGSLVDLLTFMGRIPSLD